MADKAKIRRYALHIATPFITAAIACGVLMVAAIKPADRAKVYLNLAFMDDLKTDPDDAGAGLIIREKKIVDDYSGETSDTGEFIRPK